MHVILASKFGWPSNPKKRLHKRALQSFMALWSTFSDVGLASGK